MRNISLRDLMLADSLAHIKNEVELIHPSNDSLVFDVLEQIGFDTRRGVQYIPSMHRDMQNKVGVGFVATGEYNVDPKFNKFIDTVDRVIVAGMTDISLAREMESLLGKRYIYKNTDEGDVKPRKKNDPRYYTDDELLDMGYSDITEEDDECADYYVEDETIAQQIKALEDVRVMLRGE